MTLEMVSASTLVIVCVLAIMSVPLWRRSEILFCIYVFTLACTGIAIPGAPVRLEQDTRRGAGRARPIGKVASPSRRIAWSGLDLAIHSINLSAFMSPVPAESLRYSLQIVVAVAASWVIYSWPISGSAKFRFGSIGILLFGALSLMLHVSSGSARLAGLAFEPNIMGGTAVLWLGVCVCVRARGAKFEWYEVGAVGLSVVAIARQPHGSGVVSLGTVIIAVYLVIRSRRSASAVLIAIMGCIGLAFGANLIVSGVWAVEKPGSGAFRMLLTGRVELEAIGRKFGLRRYRTDSTALLFLS